MGERNAMSGETNDRDCVARPIPGVPALECTGVSATWCPIHGDCTCPRRENDGEIEFDEGEHTCPLHAFNSEHADGGLAVGSEEPSTDALIEQLGDDLVAAVYVAASPSGWNVEYVNRTGSTHFNGFTSGDTLRDALLAALAASAPKGE